MKINDIKYFNSHKYSGKLRGFVVERENYNSPYFIVQPTHILLNGIEEELEDNEIDSQECSYESLVNVYSSEVLANTACGILNEELREYFDSLPEYPSDEILYKNDDEWDQMVDEYYQKTNYNLHNIKRYKVVKQELL